MVDIPEGIFGDKEWYDSDYMAGTCNEAMTLYYTVGEVTPPEDLFDTDPVAGTYVTSLQDITIYIGDGSNDYGTGNGKLTLTGPDGTELFSGDPDCILDDPNDWFELRYRYGIKLDEAATAEGTYTLTIPDGYFIDEEGNDVAGTTLTWFIGGNTPQPIEFFTADPANGSHVEALSTITITLTDATLVALGEGNVTVKKDGVEVATKQADYDWNADNVITVTYETSESGVYTFEFPEGYVGDEIDGDVTPYPAFTLTYYVGDATGINGISTGKIENVKIYTLDGKLIKSANGKKGIYVVNGKKVILK